MTAWEIARYGVLLGIGAAAPVGPVSIEVARRALGRGWAAGFCLGVGAVTVDVVYVCVASAGVTVLGRWVESAYVCVPMLLAGAGLLTYLGIGSLREAMKAWREGWRLSEVDGPAPALGRVYATGIAMTALNPMTLVFWFVGLPGQAMAAGVGAGQVKFLALGVFLGTLGWVIAFSGLMAGLGRFRRPWWMAAADATGGVMLLGFAMWSVMACVRRLTSAG